MYSFSFRNDIAVLKLVEPLYDNGYIEFARLPYAHQTLPNGFTCYITGWGTMDCETKYTMLCPMCRLNNHSTPSLTFFSTDSGTTPSVLQVAPLPVVAHSICSTPAWWGSIARETMVCAGGDGVVSGCQVPLNVVRRKQT